MPPAESASGTPPSDDASRVGPTRPDVPSGDAPRVDARGAGDTAARASEARSADVGRAIAWMGGALLSFSAIAITGREAMREIAATELLFWRSLSGLAVLAAIHVAMRGRAADLRSGQPLLATGRAVIHLGAQYAWLAALVLIPMVEVFALEFTAPLWVAVLAPLFLGERLTAPRLVAALIGFAGALVVVWPEGAGASPVAFVERFSLGAGSALALASAIGFAFNIMATRRLVRTDRPFVLLVWMHALQVPMTAALVAWNGGPSIGELSTLGWAAACGLAGLGAHYSLSRASKLADAIIVAPMDFLRVPLIAVVGALVYGESLRDAVLLGVALILGANALNVWSERRARR